MTVKLAVYAAKDARHPGINDSELQEGPTIIDVPDSMADNDTVEYIREAAGDLSLPPLALEAYTHTGGDITNTVDANWNVNHGDTIIFSVDEAGLNSALKSSQLGQRQTLVHALASTVTDGAVTAAQLAASINADAQLKKYIYAVAGLTANRVSLFPASPRVKFNVSGGTAQSTILFPGGDADWGKRVYAGQHLDVAAAASAYTWSYNASTRKLTIKNELGNAQARNMFLVRW